MVRSPNFSALMRRVFRWCGAAVALSMIVLARPGAVDHAMHGPREESVPVVRCSSGAEHDRTSPTQLPLGIVCGTGAGLVVGNKFYRKLSFSSDSVFCAQLPDIAQFLIGEDRDTEAYDTSRYYINRCYQTADAYFGFSNVAVSGAKATISSDSARKEMRKWLLSVLPLRIDADWFCNCVRAIEGSFEHGDEKGPLAIIAYLLKNPHCASLHTNLQRDYDSRRNFEFELWQDTAKDRSHYDTTLMSMHDLGFDSVLKYANLVVDPPPASVHLLPILLSEAKVIPNPTEAAAYITFSTSREAFVTVEIRNLLGNAIKTTCSQVLQPGSHEIPIDMSALPSGTYYARIVTAYGETRTVKIVKE
jgi:hypothetical protein